MLQRWALLSNSDAWKQQGTDIRVVVANPKSYAYLDDRRWFPTTDPRDARNGDDVDEVDTDKQEYNANVIRTQEKIPAGGPNASNISSNISSKNNNNNNNKIKNNENNKNNKNNENNTEVFRRPTPGDGVDTSCPWFNHWLWGLESGGDLSCPYRDDAVAGMGGSASAIAERYALRNVVSQPSCSVVEWCLRSIWAPFLSFRFVSFRSLTSKSFVS